MAKVTVRDIEKKDIDILSQTICDTWQFDMSFSPKLAFKMGKLYLAESILKSNFIKVACLDDKAVGIIAVRAENLKAGCIKSEWFYAKCMLPVLFNHETVKALRIFTEIEKTDSRLLEKSGGNFDSEIVLFIMDESARGLGIGGKLYSAAMEFLKKQNSADYFVYTDTMCDYGFYEHKNALKKAQEELLIPL